MNTLTYVALALLALGYPLGFLWHTRRVSAVFMAGTKILTTEMGELKLQIEEARAQKDRYFDKISEMEKQRDEWHALYTSQAIGHGNAQNLMMGEIEKLARALAVKGVRYKMPMVLQAVREEFLQTYEMPARADTSLQEMVEQSRQKLPPSA